ncbi:cell division protein FtsK [Microlunatus elymi]|uniref:Cell division protein FtsK n=1 Tax=Microlunatus elymi TaxID=2596828 RepID=A0A516PVD5_9ACTN|nr:FtsK/SpoIIIE domain-containing protein [Microlunatus elymi]QDP95154.1 cell division protein FtsK [Microlunatus elymi]
MTGSTVGSATAARGLRWLGRWLLRAKCWLALLLLTAVTVWWLSQELILVAVVVAVGVSPGLVGATWVAASPRSFERLAAGPWRRLRWRRVITSRWEAVCRDAHLAERRRVERRSLTGERMITESWRCPRLARVRTTSHAMELIIRARSGQTVTELEAGAERIGSIFDAVAVRCWPVSGSTVAIELIMRDVLITPTIGTEPDGLVVDTVRLGRTQAGRDWLLPITGRHTLCVGASGSGKGSVLWGICCGLAPAVHADLVRLWGVDLKAGVELATGRHLFSAFARTADEAVRVLATLAEVTEQRGQAMAGRTRQHRPAPSDPLHVLVIDELAALTAYAPAEVKKEADRLLARILTQGRALGVVVVAFVQDPRKEIVGMRGLFTQTVALRLRSGEETSMVLGDGMAKLAPAHRISPATPGVGWLVEDTGSTDRVRADYWSDDQIRQVATRFRTGVQAVLITPTEPVDRQRERSRRVRTPKAGAA